MKARVVRALRLSSLFAQVDRPVRDALVDAAALDLVEPDVAIFEQGAPADTLVVIGRGRARVERVNEQGAAFPLSYRGTGDVLGESCLGGVELRTERAVAMDEAEVIRLPIEVLRELCAQHPTLGGAVFALLVARQRETEDRIESMLFRNVGGRLAEFLLHAADRWGVPTPRGVLISAPITHAEIAQVIGSTRETVTLTLGALRKEGVLDAAGRRLIVKDREALTRKR
ncbi:Crp/Fnr family transcriptional regulator [Sorangium cellulosum]|uniref:Crp/Fnr family transcriptional regulator n=1 Tax=Sorangium cellulosum TaxID=56 RepID=UPI001F46D28F|nr:Crp/Fnr family transcriptional regulator [Sorangium cellulosum]